MTSTRPELPAITDFGRTERESKKRQRRNAAYVLVAFLAVIVLLGLLRSSEIVLVVLLYASIIFAGIAASILILLSESSTAGSNGTIWDSLFTKEPSRVSSGIVSEESDVVNSFYVYVKYASRGSSYSRKEIAYVLRSVFEDSPRFEKPPELLQNGTEKSSQLESDLKVVYYPYLRDSKGGVQDELTSKGTSRRSSRRERDAYLASLERVIKEINGNVARFTPSFQ